MFIIFIQLGAILSVVWFYRAKFIAIACNPIWNPEARNLLLNLIIGTLPAVAIVVADEKTKK